MERHSFRLLFFLENNGCNYRRLNLVIGLKSDVKILFSVFDHPNLETRSCKGGFTCSRLPIRMGMYDQLSYLHKNRIFIVIIPILKHVLFRLHGKTLVR